MTSPIPTFLARRVLASGFDHSEAVCWDPRRRCLWAGGEAGQVYRIGLDGSVSVDATIERGTILGVAVDGDGRVYACDIANHQVWRFHPGSDPAPHGDPIDYPNDLVFAPDGRLFVSDSGDFETPTGSVFVIDPDGTTSRLATRPIAYTNGLALRDGTLFVVESSTPCVSTVPLGGGELTELVRLERCVPDGMALDDAGGLFICCYQPNQLWHWSTASGLDLVFEDWTGEYILSPTNIAFFGDALGDLALASLCGHDLVAITPPARGVALAYPVLDPLEGEAR